MKLYVAFKYNDDFARHFVESLDAAEFGLLGDAFVFDAFDWREWFESKPPRKFILSVEKYWMFRTERGG